MTQIGSSVHSYKGASEIHFIPGDTLNVTIFTERLYLRSVQPSDLDCYASLYGDPEAVAKFHDGQPKSREYIQNRIDNIWAKRWRNYDPYNAFTIFDRLTREFLGVVILGHSDNPGEAELVGIGKKEFWKRGLATEALSAIANEYAPATVQEGYLLEGRPLTKINATARTDNEASLKLLQRVGMQLQKTEEKFGALRNHYSLELSQLSSITAQKTVNEFLKFSSELIQSAA